LTLVEPFLNSLESLSAPQEALPQAPAPAEVAHPAPDQEERAALRRKLHTIIHEQLRHECERGLPKWQLSNSSEMAEVYSSAAEMIVSYDLEISAETDAESLCEWVENIRKDPNLLKPLIQEYRPKK
jgi:hypothetical protein